MKRTVLCFVFDRVNDSLLMIHKKRGQGAGKWNVPGGKIQASESELDAAIRETQEETGITPKNLAAIGELEFYFPSGNHWENHCTVYRAGSFSGALISESEECSARWVPVKEIPFEKLWDSDRLWLPLVLEGKEFRRSYVFDENDRVTEEKITS